MSYICHLPSVADILQLAAPDALAGLHASIAQLASQPLNAEGAKAACIDTACAQHCAAGALFLVSCVHGRCSVTTASLGAAVESKHQAHRWNFFMVERCSRVRIRAFISI